MPRRERLRRSFVTLVVVVLVAALPSCTEPAPPWIDVPVDTVVLPGPDRTGTATLEATLAARRSTYRFAPDPLSTAELGQLLWAAQGVTSADGRRTAPSAGARYPLELYVLTSGSLLHYRPGTHSVDRRPAPATAADLVDPAYGQGVVADAPVLVVVAAVPDRLRVKYGERATAFADREAGHATQNLLLQANALGLAAVPVGGVDAASAARTLTLPPGESVLYLVPVGRPA